MTARVSSFVPKKVQNFVAWLHGVHKAVHENLDRFPVGEYNKLSAKKIGPLKIVEKINSNAYRLKLPSHIRCSDVFNVKHLIPYHSDSSDDDLPMNSRTNFVYPGENDKGPIGIKARFLIKMPPRRNRDINDIYEQELEQRIIARMDERFDQFVDQFVDRMNNMMNPRRRGDCNSRRSEGKESKNPFFKGDGSSLFVEHEEWEDDGVSDDDYEEAPIFDDDQYEDVIEKEEGFVDNYPNFQKDETNVPFSGVVLGVEEESMPV
ncbi:hypothetical protein Tco_0841727 [Tanacetum coccineum]|uniref:Tf2-1-like SH3-like domain-containing protein n=1 Tax=Tanacetum coccineum TaxID=301880 RepID=A0ABQ5AX78_9ASTR